MAWVLCGQGSVWPGVRIRVRVTVKVRIRIAIRIRVRVRIAIRTRVRVMVTCHIEPRPRVTSKKHSFFFVRLSCKLLIQSTFFVVSV